MSHGATADQPIAAGALGWLFFNLCGLYRLPFDAKLLAQQFPPPHAQTTLHDIAKAFGLSAGKQPIKDVDWGKLTSPLVAFVRDVSAALVPVVIVRKEADSITYFHPGHEQPQTKPFSHALDEFEPHAVLIGKEHATTNTQAIPGFEESKPAFGFKWFIPALLKHKNIWRDVLLASLSIQLVGLATPLFTQVIIDKVIAHQSHSTLMVLAVALVMFMLFTSAMSWLRQYLVLHTGNRIDAALGSEVFRHLLHLPLPYFEHRPTGTLVARMHGVETIREFITGAAISLVLDLPFLVIFLAVMFFYSWQLSLIALGLLGLICVLSVLVVPTLRQRLNEQFKLGARNQAFLTEYLSGMATVKSLQMEPDINRKYGDYLAEYLAAGFNSKQVNNTYNVVTNALEQVMSLSILVVGALIVMENDGFTVGMLVAFQMFASRMSQPMLRLASLWQEFQQAHISVKRLGDILDMPTEPHSYQPSRENTVQGRIEFRNVGFRYSEKHPWLYRNLNLTLEPGKLTVLTGPSGSGKSTLTKLMMGFYQPQEGQILLDGKDIRSMAANELRSFFGVVPQETVLFSGTVYDNLVMAQPGASFEEVIGACKKAEIHDVIEALPKGYQTELGEHGVGLSGGQRQRIAIARALLKAPSILLFDESVSNLDEKTAGGFSGTVNSIRGGVSILFITHHMLDSLCVDKFIEMQPPERD